MYRDLKRLHFPHFLVLVFITQMTLQLLLTGLSSENKEKPPEAYPAIGRNLQAHKHHTNSVRDRRKFSQPIFGLQQEEMTQSRKKSTELTLHPEDTKKFRSLWARFVRCWQGLFRATNGKSPYWKVRALMIDVRKSYFNSLSFYYVDKLVITKYWG